MTAKKLGIHNTYSTLRRRRTARKITAIAREIEALNETMSGILSNDEEERQNARTELDPCILQVECLAIFGAIPE